MNCSQPDIVIDTAILLQRVGVIDIGYEELSCALHKVINVQDMVNHAANLFNNRGQQGLITFEQLLGTLQVVAA